MEAERHLLRDFFGGYFHEDWKLVHGGVEGVVVDYRRRAPERVAALIEALERLEATAQGEDQLAAALESLGTDVDTYAAASGPHDWLSRLIAALRSSAAGGAPAEAAERELWAPRESAVEELRRALSANSAAVLYGRPGTGKSSLARWFVDRHAPEDARSVHFFLCDDLLSIETVLSGVPEGQPAFVVLDEFHRLEDPTRSLEQLLRSRPDCRFIATTREKQLGQQLALPVVVLSYLKLDELRHAAAGYGAGVELERVWKATRGHPAMTRLLYDHVLRGADVDELLSTLQPRAWPGVLSARTAPESDARQRARRYLTTIEAQLDPRARPDQDHFEVISDALAGRGGSVRRLSLNVGDSCVYSARTPDLARFLFFIDRSVWRQDARLAGVDRVATTPMPNAGEADVTLVSEPLGGGLVRHLHSSVSGETYLRLVTELDERAA